MFAMRDLNRTGLGRPTPRVAPFKAIPAERRAIRRRTLWATAIWTVAFAGFAGLVLVRILSYVPHPV